MVFPLKTTVKGPAPPCKSDQTDICDEAITFFRANVLYRAYKSSGPGDLLVCYLTIYIAENLRIFEKQKTKTLAKKAIIQLSMSQNFKIPGEGGFCLPGFFRNPKDRAEADLFRQYFRQIREECSNRLCEIAYLENGEQNKWWIQFAKRKFMNIAST